jgi:ABC-2 type transport system ATP-binding protein
VDRGRLVLQDDMRNLRAPTGNILVHSPDAAHAVSLLDGQLIERDGERLVVRHGDAAALNALLVGEGVRVSAIAEQRLSLEEVVLNVTGHGSDRIGSTP